MNLKATEFRIVQRPGHWDGEWQPQRKYSYWPFWVPFLLGDTGEAGMSSREKAAEIIEDYRKSDSQPVIVHNV